MMHSRRTFVKTKRKTKIQSPAARSHRSQVAYFGSHITDPDFGIKQRFLTTCYVSQIAPLLPTRFPNDP
jgi:hypothetical protein